MIAIIDSLGIVSEPRRQGLGAPWHKNDEHEERIVMPAGIGEKRRETHERLFAHRILFKWLDDDGAPLLWIHGGAQLELFVSLIAILTNKAETSSRQISVAHDFCANAYSPLEILRSLMYHILCQNPDAIDIWSTEYQKLHREPPSSESVLAKTWQLIQRILGFANVDVAYFILGCPENCKPGSLDEFFGLVADTKYTKCQIKWVVTSRKDAVMEKHLSTYLQINVEDDSEKEEVAGEASSQKRSV